MSNKYKISAIAIIMLVFIIPLILNLAQAQEEAPLSEDVEKIAEFGEKISDEQTRSEYLKQEWKKIFEKSEFGKVLLKIVEKTNPIFTFVFEIPIGFSWEFLYLLFLVIITLSWVSVIPRFMHLKKWWKRFAKWKK